LLDANREVQTCLIEEYSNEEKPTDGELYRKVRQYHFQHNLSFEMWRRARLRGNREQNLGGLLRYVEFTVAFDALLGIPGLWGGMKLTTLHKMIALKCDEVSKFEETVCRRSFSAGDSELPRPHSALHSDS